MGSVQNGNPSKKNESQVTRCIRCLRTAEGLTLRMIGKSCSTTQRLAYIKAVIGCKQRGLTVYPDDRYIVSYPKSGNTWMRFLVSNLVFTDDPTTFLNIERRTPDIYGHSDFFIRRIPRPRFIKSHECYEPRYRRVIYIVRDPRDVAVSFYHECVKQRWITDAYPLAAFVKDWAGARVEPEFGTWGQHVRSWLAMREGDDEFLLVRYEDLQAKCGEELARIARFLGLESSREDISRAIELSSADRMRALEKKQQRWWVTTRGTRLDKPFVRKAKVGDWRAALPRESVELIEAAWGPLMQELGYPTGAKAISPNAETRGARFSLTSAVSSAHPRTPLNTSSLGAKAT